MSTRIPFSTIRLSRLVSAGAVSLLLAMVSASPVLARTLDTAYGEVEIEGEPQRVVTLYEGALDVSVAAGITPLAAVATRGGEGVASYLESDVPGIAIVGTARETNLEAVVAQSPDLILASPQLPQEQYAILSRIAPTLVPLTEETTAESWKDEARFFAKGLGKASQIEQRLEELERRAEAIAEHVSAQGSPGASLVRWMPQGPLVMSEQLFSTGLLAAAGFEVTDAGLVKGGRPHSDPLSLENLARIDNDWLFLATLNEEGEAALESARTSPAFSRLSAVENDRVVPVNGQLWTSATGPLAASAILDRIAEVTGAGTGD
ncbi:iron-siderophore ABC transporter substrate-binding protein [Litchfieldella xinjiangensis]|uniref:ABC transporter substrate-binding protein n=1 Tax=Litchfieldella xinjiangensis TaxID=1166948 RepID=UPI0005B916A2|nr:iron-siderophore ABC transporter substrate-binding protein [Halomonas xinjiangensis]